MQSNQFPCGKITVLLLVMQTSENIFEIPYKTTLE